MQIHELNNFTGILGSDTYLAIDNGTDTSKVSAQALSDMVNPRIGTPLVAATAAAMTDHDKIYVYVGSETGYTNGNWYYWNGSAWASGGVYNSTAFVTDTTLTQAGKAADAKVTGDEITDLKSELSANVDRITSKMVEIKSNNLLFSDSDYTDGYIAKNGNVNSATTLGYSRKIPVQEGDIVRYYYYASNVFEAKNMRYVCAYDSGGSAVSASGAENVTTFTVPSGIESIVVSFVKASANKMLTINYAPNPIAYEPYFTPYFVASEEFIEDVLNEISPKYACSLLASRFRQTLGIDEKFYYWSCKSPDCTYISMTVGNRDRGKMTNEYFDIPNDGSAGSASNGYKWNLYDEHLKSVNIKDNGGYGYPVRFTAENLSDCSLLALGDSTIDSDSITGTLVNYFASKEHTITLLGTLGSGTNKNEGRAGWSASDYLTDKTYNGITNPFYNSVTETFDFSFYMTNQGYSKPDFVVVQLGINDLYGKDLTAIASTWDAVKTIVDSILSYDNTIKVLLNLPTTPNKDQSKHSVFLPNYHNLVVNYNEYVINQVNAVYNAANVRCSYCHLILDPTVDISDNVHPTTAGYNKMAMEIINQINNWQNGN